MNQAIENLSLQDIVVEGMKMVNSKADSHEHKIRKWFFVHDDFTIPGDELTSALKLDRNSIIGKYRSEIEHCYIENPKL